MLLAALVISYRQVIAAFPDGGGAYAVARPHLGPVPALVAAASLIVDYILNAAVGVSAGRRGADLRLPAPVRRPGLAVPGGARADHRGEPVGVAESARLFMVPTLAFIVAIFAVIIVGLLRCHPAVPLDAHAAAVADTSACC